MGIMDRLTDKTDWHKKVFDDTIVEKWCEEAMAIPDEEFMKVAAAPESDWAPGRVVKTMTTEGVETLVPTRVEGIMSKNTFAYVGSLV